MEQLFLDLAQELFFLIGAVAMFFIIQYIRSRFGEEKANTIFSIIEDGVLFAQQVYNHLEGDQKKEEAMNYIITRLDEKGIKVTQYQIDGMIESVLKRLKLEYGDNWR